MAKHDRDSTHVPAGIERQSHALLDMESRRLVRRVPDRILRPFHPIIPTLIYRFRRSTDPSSAS